jgi:hypothetical protein
MVNAAGLAKAVSAIFFHWAGEGAIVRPAADVQLDRLGLRDGVFTLGVGVANHVSSPFAV